jgi:hypothetical protein
MGRRGAVYPSLFGIVDWFPTLVDVAGLPPVDSQLGSGSELDREASGMSLADSLFYGIESAATRDSLLHTVHPCNGDATACGILRIGDMKLSVGRWTNSFSNQMWVPVDADNGGGCVAHSAPFCLFAFCFYP